MWTRDLAYVTALRSSISGGWIRVARPLWLRLFGAPGPSSIDELRAAIMASPLGARIESDSVVQQIYRFFDHAGAATGVPRAVADSGLAAPAGDSIAIEVQFRLSAADLDPAAQRGAIPRGPESGADGDDQPIISVLVDLPWQIALGMAPITPDWATQAPEAPTSWLEALLALKASASPVSIAFSGDAFDGSVETPPFWPGTARSEVGLSGDFSAGFTLTATFFEIDRITLGAGNDYNLVADDALVAAGGSLAVDAGALGTDERILFDGSAESDGSFSFFGGESNDYFLGGDGRDWIMGAEGADTLSGGGGGDLFVYIAAGESSGASYDTLADFDPAADRIDLPGSVAGFAAAITTGTLSTASFDADLGAALGGLGAGRAVWFAPDAGGLAGTIFLVVDGNGTAGYQAGQDYVFAVAGSPLADLTGHTDIFA
jgi:RTX calcium-binding nonapeptide repeat (4 copies)